MKPAGIRRGEARGIPHQRGYGLLLALIVLVVLVTALGLVASSMRMSVLEDQRNLRTVSLIALSDAVMAETLARLAQNEAFEGVEERPFGDGTIRSEVHPLGGSRVEVFTRARYAGQERTMVAWVALGGGPPAVLSWRRAP